MPNNVHIPNEIKRPNEVSYYHHSVDGIVGPFDSYEHASAQWGRDELKHQNIQPLNDGDFYLHNNKGVRK